MASDRRTGGRLEDHPDQPRAAFGRARRMDAFCRTCLCSCALDPTRVAKSSPLRHPRHRAQRAIWRSPNAHQERARAGVVPVHPCDSELEHRRCRNEATAGARPRSVRAAELDEREQSASAGLGLRRLLLSAKAGVEAVVADTLRVKRRPSPLSDDEGVVALDPAVRGEDEEVEPDSETVHSFRTSGSVIATAPAS